MERVIRNGLVAVLYSPGWGAGWSTWARGEEREALLFHPALVECVERGGNVQEALNAIGLGEVYAGGASTLTIAWLPVGTRFVIREYDGSEHVERLDEIEHFTA